MSIRGYKKVRKQHLFKVAGDVTDQALLYERSQWNFLD